MTIIGYLLIKPYNGALATDLMSENATCLGFPVIWILFVHQNWYYSMYPKGY